MSSYLYYDDPIDYGVNLDPYSNPSSGFSFSGLGGWGWLGVVAAGAVVYDNWDDIEDYLFHGGVEDDLKRLGRKFDEEVIQPLYTFQKDFVNGILEDPLEAFVKLTMALTGNGWLIPVLNEVDTYQQIKDLQDQGYDVEDYDLGDGLENIAKGYALGKISGEIGQHINKFKGMVPDVFKFSDGILLDATFEGIQNAGAALVLGDSASDAFSKYFNKSFSGELAEDLIGGMEDAAGAVLGVVDKKFGSLSFTDDNGVFKPLPDAVQNIVAASINAEMEGREITDEVIASAVAKTNVVTSTISKYMSQTELYLQGLPFTDTKSIDDALSFLTMGVQNAISVALAGGTGEQAANMLLASIDAMGQQEFKNFLDNSFIGNGLQNGLDYISGDYKAAKEAVARQEQWLVDNPKFVEYMGSVEAARVELSNRLNQVNSAQSSAQALITRWNDKTADDENGKNVFELAFDEWVETRPSNLPPSFNHGVLVDLGDLMGDSSTQDLTNFQGREDFMSNPNFTQGKFVYLFGNSQMVSDQLNQIARKQGDIVGASVTNYNNAMANYESYVPIMENLTGDEQYIADLAEYNDLIAGVTTTLSNLGATSGTFYDTFSEDFANINTSVAKAMDPNFDPDFYFAIYGSAGNGFSANEAAAHFLGTGSKEGYFTNQNAFDVASNAGTVSDLGTFKFENGVETPSQTVPTYDPTKLKTPAEQLFLVESTTLGENASVNLFGKSYSKYTMSSYVTSEDPYDWLLRGSYQIEYDLRRFVDANGLQVIDQNWVEANLKDPNFIDNVWDKIKNATIRAASQSTYESSSPADIYESLSTQEKRNLLKDDVKRFVALGSLSPEDVTVSDTQLLGDNTSWEDVLSGNANFDYVLNKDTGEISAVWSVEADAPPSTTMWDLDSGTQNIATGSNIDVLKFLDPTILFDTLDAIQQQDSDLADTSKTADMNEIIVYADRSFVTHIPSEIWQLADARRKEQERIDALPQTTPEEVEEVSRFQRYMDYWTVVALNSQATIVKSAAALGKVVTDLYSPAAYSQYLIANDIMGGEDTVPYDGPYGAMNQEWLAFADMNERLALAASPQELKDSRIDLERYKDSFGEYLVDLDNFNEETGKYEFLLDENGEKIRRDFYINTDGLEGAELISAKINNETLMQVGGYWNAPTTFLVDLVATEIFESAPAAITGGVAGLGTKFFGTALTVEKGFAGRIAANKVKERMQDVTIGVGFTTDVLSASGTAYENQFSSVRNLVIQQMGSQTVDRFNIITQQVETVPKYTQEEIFAEADKIADVAGYQSFLTQTVSLMSMYGVGKVAAERALFGSATGKRYQFNSAWDNIAQRVDDVGSIATIALREGAAGAGDESILSYSDNTFIRNYIDPNHEVTDQVISDGVLGFIIEGAIGGTQSLATNPTGIAAGGVLLGYNFIPGLFESFEGVATAFSVDANTNAVMLSPVVFSQVETINNNIKLGTLTVSDAVQEMNDFFDDIGIDESTFLGSDSGTQTHFAAVRNNLLNAVNDADYHSSNEVAQEFATFGYTPSSIEISQFTLPAGTTNLNETIETYVEPFVITTADIESISSSIGSGVDLTLEEISKLAGRYSEDTKAEALANLPLKIEESRFTDANEFKQYLISEHGWTQSQVDAYYAANQAEIDTDLTKYSKDKVDENWGSSFDDAVISEEEILEAIKSEFNDPSKDDQWFRDNFGTFISDNANRTESPVLNSETTPVIDTQGITDAITYFNDTGNDPGDKPININDFKNIAKTKFGFTDYQFDELILQTYGFYGGPSDTRAADLASATQSMVDYFTSTPTLSDDPTIDAFLGPYYQSEEDVLAEFRKDRPDYELTQADRDKYVGVQHLTDENGFRKNGLIGIDDEVFTEEEKTQVITDAITAFGERTLLRDRSDASNNFNNADRDSGFWRDNTPFTRQDIETEAARLFAENSELTEGQLLDRLDSYQTLNSISEQDIRYAMSGKHQMGNRPEGYTGLQFEQPRLDDGTNNTYVNPNGEASGFIWDSEFLNTLGMNPFKEQSWYTNLLGAKGNLDTLYNNQDFMTYMQSANDKVTTVDEARAYLTSTGFDATKLTDEDILAIPGLVGTTIDNLVSSTDSTGVADTYLAPRQYTRAEAERDLRAELGLAADADLSDYDTLLNSVVNMDGDTNVEATQLLALQEGLPTTPETPTETPERPAGDRVTAGSLLTILKAQYPDNSSDINAAYLAYTNGTDNWFALIVEAYNDATGGLTDRASWLNDNLDNPTISSTIQTGLDLPTTPETPTETPEEKRLDDLFDSLKDALENGFTEAAETAIRNALGDVGLDLDALELAVNELKTTANAFVETDPIAMAEIAALKIVVEGLTTAGLSTEQVNALIGNAVGAQSQAQTDALTTAISTISDRIGDVEEDVTDLSGDVSDILGRFGQPATDDTPATGFYLALENLINSGAGAEASIAALEGALGTPATTDAEGNPQPATGVYAYINTIDSENATALQTAINGLRTFITNSDADINTEIQAIADVIGKPAREVTAQDISDVQGIIGRPPPGFGVEVTPLTEAELAYDVNQDGTVDQTDLDILQQLSDPSVFGDPTGLSTESEFAASGFYDIFQDIESRQEQDARTTAETLAEMNRRFEADREAREAQDRAREQARQMDAFQQYMMRAGQVTTPKGKKGYSYDFDSIFQTPDIEEQYFIDPFSGVDKRQEEAPRDPFDILRRTAAKGGLINDQTDELLKILGD